MTEAYPLRWPDGWRRTPEGKRERGRQFMRGGWNGSLPSFAYGRDCVLEELRKLGARNVVISTSVDVKENGVPRYGVDADKRGARDPGAAIYFTLKGRQMIMAQDAYDSIGVNLRSLTLALDALRALERHGGGAMMDRAFDGFAALPPPAGSKPRRPWWQVLRFPDKVEDRVLISVKEVTARYQTLAKMLHPDATGNGEDEGMAELNVAYEDAKKELGGTEA